MRPLTWSALIGRVLLRLCISSAPTIWNGDAHLPSAPSPGLSTARPRNNNRKAVVRIGDFAMPHSVTATAIGATAARTLPFESMIDANVRTPSADTTNVVDQTSNTVVFPGLGPG